jgi:hypothetical protein
MMQPQRLAPGTLASAGEVDFHWRRTVPTIAKFASAGEVNA